MCRELKSGYSQEDPKWLVCVLYLSSEKTLYHGIIYALGDTTLFPIDRLS